MVGQGGQFIAGDCGRLRQRIKGIEIAKQTQLRFFHHSQAALAACFQLHKPHLVSVCYSMI